MTRTVHDPLEQLRDTLEEQFQRYTNELTELTVRSRRPDHGGYDGDTMAARLSAASRGVAETARALRRMAEGTYGFCERCTVRISMERLEILPHARFCVPCSSHPFSGEPFKL